MNFSNKLSAREQTSEFIDNISNTSMSLSKRPLHEVVSPDTETKKPRKTIADKNEQIKTCIEDLPNEVFYDIFEYLDGCDIYYAFSNLNIRFNHLFNDSLLPIKIYRSTSFHRISHEDYRQFLLDNRHRINSLYAKTFPIKLVFSLILSKDRPFDRLESLIIENPPLYMARLFLQYLTKLPGLLSLKMNIDMDTLQWDELYTWILRLPNLKYNKLSLLVPFYFQPFPYHIDSISHLQHLVINHTCDLNNLLTVLTHTPYLTHLTCSHLTPTHATGIDLSSNDPSLKYVCIKKCSLKFDQFEILIKNFCSQLDILKFSTSGDRSYLNGDHWKQLISKHIPRLQIFNFEYTGAVLPYHPSHSSFSHFISSFWLEHKWFFELQICTSTTSPIEMKCSIQPFKKPWYQALDEQNFHPMTNDSNSTNGSFPCLRLVMEDLQLFGYNKIYEDYVNSIANQVEFTNLHIDLPQFSIFFLIKTLYLLPNLDSLTITSEHPETTKILSEEQTTMFNFISNHNKITKLNLEQMSEIDQVHILLSLCSNIHYFQVKCRNLFDAEWLLQYVLTQRLKTLLPNLKLISVWLSNADDRIMNDLQKITDTQKLLENYTIKRICDRIYVSWN